MHDMTLFSLTRVARAVAQVLPREIIFDLEGISSNPEWVHITRLSRLCSFLLSNDECYCPYSWNLVHVKLEPVRVPLPWLIAIKGIRTEKAGLSFIKWMSTCAIVLFPTFIGKLFCLWRRRKILPVNYSWWLAMLQLSEKILDEQLSNRIFFLPNPLFLDLCRQVLEYLEVE